MKWTKLVLAIPLVLLLCANSQCVLETGDDDDDHAKTDHHHPKTPQQAEANGTETR